MPDYTIDKRHLIGSALAGAAAAMTSHAVAATDFVGAGRPIIALSDGYFDMPSDMFLGTPRSLRHQLGNPTRIAANTYARRSGERTFLFDAGAGTNDFIAQSFPTVGQLPEDLNSAGIDALDVTDIVITHMHPDHIGGLVVGDQLAFPNARIHIAGAEWDFWNADGFATAAPEAMRPMIGLVQDISRIVDNNVSLHSGSGNIGGGVNVIPAVGHTPGHTAIVLDDGQEQVILVGDLTVHEAVHFANPDFGWALYIDGDMAVRSRKSLLDLIASDQMVMGAAHVSEPGLGRVERAGNGFRFIPL